ncbi:MAG TPA: prepilin-type N-terminal cleavage/methylation domain-containing protein [Armatimonadota bacterium]|jgi:prepilin-type N-terminal cleavage/methylation domain-containing protein
MKHLRSRSGFTLVELLISCVILGIGMVALLHLYMVSMWSYQKARYIALATVRAQHELEKAENLKFNVMRDRANLIGDSRYQASEGYSELVGRNGVEFAISALPNGHGTVTVSNFHGHANLLQIEIRISWEGPSPTQSPIHMSTLLSG